jgi:hypothetical protein
VGHALNDTAPSQPLDTIRTRWRNATLKDAPALAADVTAWQAILWKTCCMLGNYIQASWNASGGYQQSLSRQIPNDPPAVDSVPLRLAVKPSPGESEVTLYLAAKEEARGVVDTRVRHLVSPSFRGIRQTDAAASRFCRLRPCLHALTIL